jgi:hypothetical protein
MGTTTLQSTVRRDTLVAHRTESHPPGPVGHSHYWDRALSRGALMKGAGALAATSLLLPGAARAGGGRVASAAPSPIPANPDFFGLHVYFPVEGVEPASIFDFNGFCGVTELQGTGTLTMDGKTTHAVFDVDNRFMTGEYVGADGRMHHGTFGFI